MQDLVRAGYNMTEMRKPWGRSVRVWGARLAIAGGIILCLGAFGARYLAHLPRERGTGELSRWERVKLGFGTATRAVALVLSTPEDDPKNTKLPIAQLYVAGQDLDALTANLPTSGDVYHSVLVRLGKRELEAEAKLRGDSINHWAFPQKSWRIRLKGAKLYRGMRAFNLNVPRTASQMENWIGNEIAHRIGGGLLIPYAEIVHFRLNRQFNGLRLLLEQPGPEFLERLHLPQGKMFVGDISTADVYGKKARRRLFHDARAWELRVDPKDSQSKAELEALIQLLSRETNPYLFKEKLSRIVDVNALLHYMAMLELVGSTHIDETHNHKFYLNPVSGRLIPVVWDTVAYLWKRNGSLDLAPNALFRQTLLNPGLREAKDKILWNAVNGDLAAAKIKDLIHQKASEIRPDLYASALKVSATMRGVEFLSNREWEKELRNLDRVIEDTHTYIVKQLKPSELRYRLSQTLSPERARVALQVRSRSGVIVSKLRLEIDPPESGIMVTLTREGLSDLNVPVDPSKATQSAVSQAGVVEFDLGETLYSKRKFDRSMSVVPATYLYQIELPSKFRAERVRPLGVRGSVSGQNSRVEEDRGIAVADRYSPSSVWWDPDFFAERRVQTLQGDVRIDKNLIIGLHSHLEILAGSKVRVSPGVSIVIDGGTLEVKGTGDSPVEISPWIPHTSWGALVLRDGAQARLAHVKISGAGYARFMGVPYEGGLSAYESNLLAEGVELDGSFLDLRKSNAKLSDVVVRNNLSMSLRQIDSTITGEVKAFDSQLSPPQVISKPSLQAQVRNYRGVGRDLSIPVGKASVQQVSRDLFSALEAAFSDPKDWQLPGVRLGTTDQEGEELERFFEADIGFQDTHTFSKQYALVDRFRNFKTYQRYLRYPSRAEYWPTSVGYRFASSEQIQSSSFFNDVTELVSFPFEQAELVRYLQTGIFRGNALHAYQQLQREIPDAGAGLLGVKKVVTVERYRRQLSLEATKAAQAKIEIAAFREYDPKESQVYIEERTRGIRGAEEPKQKRGYLTLSTFIAKNVDTASQKRINGIVDEVLQKKGIEWKPTSLGVLE